MSVDEYKLCGGSCESESSASCFQYFVSMYWLEMFIYNGQALQIYLDLMLRVNQQKLVSCTTKKSVIDR